MAASNAGKVPVTMLSGFLGAGKTTLLRYLLENSKLKIACVVNDVASINIDAKLVRNDRNRSKTETTTTKDLADTVELQNGCACCNLQDELFASFEQVLSMADKRGEPYARIVLENSGVAEPANIRDKFKEAEEQGHPLLDRIYLDTLVTVVDSSTFGKDFASRQPLAARPDLGDGGNLRPIVDLLVEQIECADFVVLNKTDLLAANAPAAAEGSAQADALQELVAIVSSLNPLATVVPCAQGQVPLETVFGANAHAVVAKLNIEGQHRGAVAAARAAQADEGPESKRLKGDHDHHHHDHKHEHNHADHGHHHHDHKHEHNHADHDHHQDCAACTHDHDHKHEHSHADHAHHDDCAVCEAAPKHSHDDHEHHDDCAACTHDHDHHHHHHKHEERPATRAAERFGIKSFVYSRRRPFHPQRLKEMVLKWLPVSSNTAIDAEAPELGDSPIKAVIRSKGFMWMSNSHTTAYYWSHAGQHFEIRDEGDWWAAVPEADWPTETSARDVILADWDLEVSSTNGDRRQEIVFIGVGMDQDKICAQLDGALLNDQEMTMYQSRWASVPDPEHPAVEAYKQSASKHADHNPEHHHHHAHEHVHHDHKH